MKRFAFFLAFLLLLTGCSAEEVLKEPPGATVICGDQQIPARSGSYHWDYDSSSVIADGVHPLDSQAETVVTDQATATLRFEVEPQNISVECWSEDQRGNNEAKSSYVQINGNEFPLRSGSYIYAIHASWEAKRYRGSATYVAAINTTAAEPTLTKPPVLTVTCGDKTATAKLGTYTWHHGTGDQTVTTNADSSHPLLLLTAEDRMDFTEGKVALNFETAPDRMESFCWYDSDLGKTIGGNDITDYWNSSYQMDSGNGSYIVEIRAYWDDRNGYSGNASYCFYINKQPSK